MRCCIYFSAGFDETFREKSCQSCTNCSGGGNILIQVRKFNIICNIFNPLALKLIPCFFLHLLSDVQLDSLRTYSKQTFSYSVGEGKGKFGLPTTSLIYFICEMTQVKTVKHVTDVSLTGFSIVSKSQSFVVRIY